MFGLIQCEPAEAEDLFLPVCLRGERSLGARLSACAAARSLRRRGVEEAVFPPGYPYVETFRRRGVRPVSPCPLFRAVAPALALRGLEKLGVPCREATVTLAGRGEGDLERAAEALARQVRHLALCGEGVEGPARRLLLRLGAAVRAAAPGETVRCHLILRFDPTPVRGGPCLNLFEAEGSIGFAEGEAAYLTALWRGGRLDPETLHPEIFRYSDG